MPWTNDAPSRAGFWRLLIPKLGHEVTSWRLAWFEEWQRWEQTGAGFNPLATTQGGGEDPAVPWWNTFGDRGQYHVRNYAGIDAGVTATAITITNGYYPALVEALARQDVSSPLQVAANIDTWGTTGFANALRNGWRPAVTSPVSGGVTLEDVANSLNNLNKVVIEQGQRIAALEATDAGFDGTYELRRVHP